MTGSPRLKIKMDPRWGEFWADYDRGSGTDTLTFVYTVAEPNTSPQGIAVLANTLELNGGKIRLMSDRTVTPAWPTPGWATTQPQGGLAAMTGAENA